MQSRTELTAAFAPRQAAERAVHLDRLHVAPEPLGWPHNIGEMPPDRRSLLMHLKGNRNRDDVLGILRTLESLRDEWEYAQAIAALGDVNEPVRARKLLAELPRRGIRPSVFCFNACIKAVGRSGDWREALELLDEMGDRGVPPTTHSFSAALSALDKAGECDRALSLLRKIQRTHSPDGFCFSPVIHSLGSSGRPEEALALLDEVLSMRLPERDLVGCFNSGLHTLAVAGRLDEAERLLERMRNRRVDPTELSYGALINAAGTPQPQLRNFCSNFAAAAHPSAQQQQHLRRSSTCAAEASRRQPSAAASPLASASLFML